MNTSTVCRDLTYRCLMDTTRPSATLASCSLRLELYADAGKTNFFSGTVLAGETVHVEGRYPSASVGAETVVWEWTDSQQQTQQLCQRFTVFSLRIFGDINLDGTVDTVDRALQASLPGHGWAMPSAPGILRPLLLQTDNQLPGRFTLGLGGTPGAFRVWRTAQPGTNDTPLLVCGRAVTNGVGGAYFAEFGSHDLYVEAISNGTAVLTYTYAGTGAAEGLFCSASLRMTALAARLEPVTTASNNQGVIYNPAGVAVGGLALYRVEVEPGEGIPDTAIHWSRNNGNIAFYDGHDTGREAIVRGVAPGDYKLEVSIDGLPSTYRPYIHGRVLEPKTVPIYAYIICSNGVPAVSVDTVNAWVAEANRIYRQVAMTFVLESVQHVISNDWFNIGNYIELLQMCAHASNTGGLELYCVNNMGAAGVNLTGCGMAVRANAKLYVLAHEIGHACGLRDIIDSPVGIAVSEALSGASNWSGGEGTGYHDPALKHDALVRRLLMHHVAGLQKVDIPRAGVTGRTHGLTIDSFISVGLANMSTREPRH